ncbi:MAG: alpha-1 4-glucan-protein synthase, partial [Halolamina sp.]
GGPLCEHNKAPRSTFDDLQNEVAGLELNEHVWKVIDNVDPKAPRAAQTAEPSEDDAGAGATSFREAFEAMADALATGDFTEWNNGAFLNYCGEYMNDWLDCLSALDAPAAEPQEVAADD